jgi:hypothetical protein
VLHIDKLHATTDRILRSVSVNGVELIVFETIHNAVCTDSTAMPVEDFARMLAAEKAVLITLASE